MSKPHTVYYLVDTENPGGFNTVEDLLKKTAEEKCRIILFYSDNTSKLAPSMVERMLEADCVRLIRVGTGRNSLDFCLISMAGYLCAKHPKATFVILSDDHGYDNAIRMWQDSGIRMIRSGSPQKSPAKKPETPQKTAAAPKKAANTSKKSGPSEKPAFLLEALPTGETAAPGDLALEENCALDLPDPAPQVPALPDRTASASPLVLDGTAPLLPRGARQVSLLDASCRPSPEELLQAAQALLSDAGITQIPADALLQALATDNPQDTLRKTCDCPASLISSLFQKTDRAQRKALSRLAQRALSGEEK
ncbi:MAG: PIN domain-containing protein [Lachnospiraceae bacterium]